MHHVRWALLAALAACTPAKEGSDSAAARPEAWVYDADTADSTPDLTAIAASVEVAIGLLDEVPATPLLDAHETALGWRDEVCPHVAIDGSFGQWLGICTAEDGTRFSGGVFFYDVTDDDLSGAEGFWKPNDAKIPEGTLYTGRVWHGQAYIRGASGADFLASGLLADLTAALPDGGIGTLQHVSGQFLWTGPGAEDGWLASGTWPYFGLHRFAWPERGASVAQIDGSISFDQGQGVEAVTFADATLALGVNHIDCGLEPSGSVQWRSPEGRWVTLTFDLSDDGTIPDGACDGCGVATHDGEALGEVCIDFSGLLGDL